MQPNPLARQRRLGQALLNLRTSKGHSHAELARLSGVSASAISRLENPCGESHRRPSIRAVRQLLDALGVPRDSERFRILDQWAEEAGAPRWWDRHQRMGDGQRTFALVELGASHICDYAGMLMPGLMQTPEYARHRVQASNAPISDPEPIVAGRIARRQVLDTATYRLVLEEQAIRRRPVPAQVMIDQLEYLLVLAERPNISIRVVPVDADLGDGYTPRGPFSHITYPDRGDPKIVIVDNDAYHPRLVVADGEVDGYARLHERLWNACLSETDSTTLIREVAGKLRAAG